MKKVDNLFLVQYCMISYMRLAFYFFVMINIILLAISSNIRTFSRYKSRLAVDYGPNAIGIANSDFLGCIKPRITLIHPRNTTTLSVDVLLIAKQVQAMEIIVGIPVDSNGKLHYGINNFNGNLCLNFSKVLAATASHFYPNITVILADERYTTREAKHRLTLERSTASLDAMSAACLLERFVEDEGCNTIPAQLCSFPPPPELEIFDYDVVKNYIRETHFNNQDSMGKFEFNKNRLKNMKFSKPPKF